MIRERSGMYNSPPGEEERFYDADDWQTLIKHFISTGVFLKNGGLLVTVSADSLYLEMTQGFAYIDGHWYDLSDKDDPDSKFALVPQEAVSAPYIGRVVIRSSELVGERRANVYFKPGEENNTPLPPELERNDDVYEICVAEIIVRPGMPLNTNDLKDTRFNKQLCGVADFAPNPKIEPVMMQGFAQSYNLAFELPVEGWVIADETDYPLHAGEWMQRFPVEGSEDSNIYSDCDGFLEIDYSLIKYGVERPSQSIAKKGYFVTFYGTRPIVPITGQILFLRGGNRIGG